MTNLYLFSVVLLVVAILIVVRHFMQSKLRVADQKNMRGETNKDLYHEHLQELEKDYAEGGIDEENFGYLKSELDRSLIQDISATEKESAAVDKKTSVLWPIAISVFIVVFTVGYYSQFGQYKELETALSQPAGHPQGEQSEAQMMIAQLKVLHKEVQDNPQNSDAWFRLGQILTNVGEFESAVIAFDKVISIEGPQADVYAMQAQAMYYQNKQQRNAKIDELLNKALAIDPNDPTTLMLIGMDHYLRQEYSLAAQTWQKILDTNGAGVNSQALQSAINEAVAMSGQPAVKSQPEQQSTNSVAVTGPNLKVSVSIADNIINELNSGADKTVFIYAVATSGARMPLAAVKLRASDLPITVNLDDSKAMTPQMNLSSVDAVNIYAVISHTGQPGMKAGDFKGELTNISVNVSEQMNLVIDSIVQ
ncbi:c-type cytochrome biogenesis protein CcmI [Thalassomonas sp. M1454]|uniref:c-type cytochrome biogenesis protein CcmI n=1 Tax=Thalassomonas sp. M1454 TaxID=2594477 RepID=UPI00117C06F9|nr:c-type cytochrome biogenesis protein CcmI [Thalassomonas sp. M1454]TRX54012.1 c-type cytochrome biogenesis protein CcmI [Thalassomonas sp. M1454]